MVDFSLQLDGITGSGAPQTAIPVESFSFGASHPTTPDPSGPSGAAKVSLSEVFSGGGLPLQSMSLSIARVSVEWSSAAGGPPVTAGWDLTTGTAV